MTPVRIWITWPRRARPHTDPSDQYWCLRCHRYAPGPVMTTVPRREKLRRWHRKTTVTGFQHKNRCPA